MPCPCAFPRNISGSARLLRVNCLQSHLFLKIRLGVPCAHQTTALRGMVLYAFHWMFKTTASPLTPCILGHIPSCSCTPSMTHRCGFCCAIKCAISVFRHLVPFTLMKFIPEVSDKNNALHVIGLVDGVHCSHNIAILGALTIFCL